MSYLQNKKEKNKKLFIGALCFAVLLIVLIYHKPIFSGIARGAHTIFTPVFSGVNNIGGGVSAWREKIRTKRYLVSENERLTTEVTRLSLEVQSTSDRQKEIDQLRELLGRIPESQDILLAHVIVPAGKSLYDALIIDAGEREGIEQGFVVKAHGIIPIGFISDVYKTSSRVTLYSAPGVRTDAIVEANGLWTVLVGRGGGSFEINLPQSVQFTEGMQVFAPGSLHELLATAEEIISDPRDPGQTILLSSPVNIHELTQVVIVK
jgi:cell shape-determining protein MreC